MLPEDLSQVAALEAACFGSDAWSEQALEQALSDKNALYLSCMEEGRLIACCGIWQSFEDGDITNVAVEEGRQKKRLCPQTAAGTDAPGEALRRGKFYVGGQGKQSPCGPAI